MASSIVAYPNPPNNGLTIEVKNEKIGQQYEIFNSLGLIAVGQIVDIKTKVDVAELASGQYQVRIRGELGFKSFFIP